jgi:hypothetical protein
LGCHADLDLSRLRTILRYTNMSRNAMDVVFEADATCNISRGWHFSSSVFANGFNGGLGVGLNMLQPHVRGLVLRRGWAFMLRYVAVIACATVVGRALSSHNLPSSLALLSGMFTLPFVLHC